MSLAYNLDEFEEYEDNEDYRRQNRRRNNKKDRVKQDHRASKFMDEEDIMYEKLGRKAR